MTRRGGRRLLSSPWRSPPAYGRLTGILAAVAETVQEVEGGLVRLGLPVFPRSPPIVGSGGRSPSLSHTGVAFSVEQVSVAIDSDLFRQGSSLLVPLTGAAIVPASPETLKESPFPSLLRSEPLQ